MLDKDIQEVNKFLHGFNQRKLNQAEHVLLAYAFAMNMELIPRDEENAKIYFLTYKNIFDEMYYKVCEFSYISEESKSEIIDLICKFTIWRKAVAYGNITPLFTGNADTVIDELSGLVKFVDGHVLCEIAGSIDKANYILSSFRLLYIVSQKAVAKRNKQE